MTDHDISTASPEEQRRQIDVWLRYLKQNETSCKEEIEAKRKEIDEYEALKTKVADMPKKLEKDVFIPIGRMAFLPGTLDHTNEFYALLGDNVFVKKSAFQTAQLLERRQDAIKEPLKALEEELKLVEQRTQFAEQLVGTTSTDEVEIREPYDEAAEAAAAKRRRRVQPVTKPEHEDIMKRLDELEITEVQNNEMEGGTTAMDASAIPEAISGQMNIPADEPMSEVVQGKPKNVSDADYQKLLNYLDQLEAQSEDDMEVGEDEEAYDSDDLEEKEESYEEEQPEPPKKKSLKSSPVKSVKKGVRFNDAPLGPTAASPPTSSAPIEIPTSEPAHSILKPAKFAPRVDRQAVEAMDRRDKVTILPELKSVFTGEIQERDPMNILSRAEQQPKASEPKPASVSRFKAHRIGK